MKKYMKCMKNVWHKLVEHIYRTWINKVIVLAVIGLASVISILTDDGGPFACALMFFGPIFFMNKEVFC